MKKGFRKNGVSKENSKGPIVQMGLFIDNNGIPVSHKLFSGNTQDKTTFKNVLENDIAEMDLGRIVVVADKGMNTQENKYLITDKGNGYIVNGGNFQPGGIILFATKISGRVSVINVIWDRVIFHINKRRLI